MIMVIVNKSIPINEVIAKFLISLSIDIGTMMIQAIMR